ncbi:uncharacterized protein EV420DRAFT_1474879 [Desarmillaria tabescens]|uniref:DUF6589 domain-containing protein n=1 Tax=Armillaria tabescens TaxID=1929756 RepID=A0AA39T5K9_ARMTA|nr:uncharacterized protein EV420DRAFT_1474879 [Desarmillaria tabescens]KAK0466076.1 hypothetical protein EV420DRAFT_1474879 [Desarmillaria tabescens]
MASADSLQYDNDFWQDRLGPASQFSTEKKCHLVFSLLIFLMLSLANLLEFIFSSKLVIVKQRVGKFMAYSSMGTTDDTRFPPAMIFRLWHENYPKSRRWLHDMVILGCAKEIVLEESNKLINDGNLRIKLSDLTMEKIWELLKPESIAAKYKEAAPFLWGILHTFAASPNRYRHQNLPRTTGEETEIVTGEDFQGTEDLNVMDDLQEDPERGSARFAALPPGFLQSPEFAIIMTISMLIFICNRATNILPIMLGLFFKINGTSSRVLTMLSNVGVCVSEDTVEQVKKRLSEDAINLAVQVMTSDKLYAVIFDNINIYLRKFQQRVTNHHSMINATNAALITRYCPGNENWDKRTEILTDVGKMMPEDHPLQPKKTKAYPLGVFDKNEGSKKGIVGVLTAIKDRSTLTAMKWASKVRTLLGDWLTSNNFHGARRDRMDDVNDMERLAYGQELSTLWHYALQATHMIMRVHFGFSTDLTSLAAHKTLLGRSWDVKKPNYAAAKSLIRHSLIARLLHMTMICVGFSTWTELSGWQPTAADIKNTAHEISLQYVSPKSTEEAQTAGDDWLAHSIYFVRDSLLFCEFEDAVAYADAGRVLRVMKFWCLAYQGSLLLTWQYELNDALRATLECAWFYNRWGLPGRFIATDLYMEQLNYWVKRGFIAQGSGMTIQYIIEKGSTCVEAFRDVSHRVANFFGDSDRARRSKESSFKEDLKRLVDEMVRLKLHNTDEPEQHLVPATVRTSTRSNRKDKEKSAIVDVQVVGAEIWNDGKFADFLKRTTYDPTVGYPISGGDSHDAESLDDTDPFITGTTSFDDPNINPLVHDSFNDLHGDEVIGLGSLGGGGEYYNGPEGLS